MSSSTLLADGLLERLVNPRGQATFCFADPKGYEIRPAGDTKGLGVFATREYHEGDRILCEKPLLRWSARDGMVRPGHDLRKLVAKLPPAAQEAFFALVPVPLHSTSLAKNGIGATDIAGRVWMANAYPAREMEGSGEHSSSSAVYSDICRINHGCNPNCIHSWNETLQRQTVHATRAIGVGEELELTYLGVDRDAPPRVERQTMLEEHFGFRCSCTLCALPAEQSQLSDARRSRLVELCTLLHEERPGGEGTRSFSEVSALLEERLRLLRQEGVSEVFAHGAMLVVSSRAREHGHVEVARHWAERALECATTALGADSMHYRLYAEWVAQLKAHHDEGAVDAAAAAASAGSTSYAAITSINSTTASHPDALPLRSGAQSAEGAPPMRAPPAATAQDEGAPIGEWPIRLLRATHGGRYVVATRPLRAGECVFCEAAPIAQTVTDSFSGLVCHCCYATLEEPLEEPTKGNDAASPSRLGCDECGGVWFCSLACKDALADVHRGECELVSQLRKAGVTAETSNLRLYLRLVQLAFEDGAACAQIEQMHEHYDDCDATRRQSLETQAEGLLDLLPPTMRMERTRVARLIDRVHTNAFAVADPTGLVRGTGLYVKAGSWFNHSCDPTAVVSFLGRMLRVHVLRDLGEGEEVSVSYVELYAGRAARQAALRAKKGFACVCLRCETPPATDAALEGWQCTGQVGCQSGCVPPGATACTSCGTAHKLAPAARAAVEDRWRQSLDEWSSALLGGRSAKPIRELARELLPSIETFLRSDSADRLCEAHALRQRAFVLRSYAFAAAGAPPDCLVDAIECCLDGMAAHLDPAQPHVLFFHQRLSAALARQAEVELAAGNLHAAAKTRQRAREVGLAAAQGLEVAYGVAHPLVEEWRREAESV